MTRLVRGACKRLFLFTFNIPPAWSGHGALHYNSFISHGSRRLLLRTAPGGRGFAIGLAGRSLVGASGSAAGGLLPLVFSRPGADDPRSRGGGGLARLWQGHRGCSFHGTWRPPHPD